MLAYMNALRNIVCKPLTMRQLPIHIQIELTTYCNLDCKACSRSKMLDQAQHLTVDHLASVIDAIRPVKVSLSGGGEPFMNPHVFEMIRHVKSLGSSINTTTNATLLTSEVCERIIVSGLDLLKVSLDGATRETYQYSRGNDCFGRVIEGVKRLIDTKKRQGSIHPFIRFNYVILKGNYSEMAKTVKLAAELGVDAIYFQPLDLIGIEERIGELVGDLREEQLLHEIRRALDVANNSSVNTNLHTLLKIFPLYWKKYTLETRQYDRRRCVLPWFSTYITLEGDVLPCCSCSPRESVMGNAFDRPFYEIWNGTRYQNFRRAIRAGKRPYPVCTNCVPETMLDILNSARILPGFLQ